MVVGRGGQKGSVSRALAQPRDAKVSKETELSTRRLLWLVRIRMGMALVGCGRVSGCLGMTSQWPDVRPTKRTAKELRLGGHSALTPEGRSLRGRRITVAAADSYIG